MERARGAASDVGGSRRCGRRRFGDRARNATAASPMTGAPAVADEVTASPAAWFNSYAGSTRRSSKQAGTFHDEFARLLAAAGTAYAGTEAGASKALAAPLTSDEPTPVGISLDYGPHLHTDTDTAVPERGLPPLHFAQLHHHQYPRPHDPRTSCFRLPVLRSMTLDQSRASGRHDLEQRDNCRRTTTGSPPSTFSATRKARLSPRWKCRNSSPPASRARM